MGFFSRRKADVVVPEPELEVEPLPEPEPEPEPIIEPEPEAEPEPEPEPDPWPEGEYRGRLAIIGDHQHPLFGHLVADQATKVGERTVIVHDENGAARCDDNGDPFKITVPVYEYGPVHGYPVFHNTVAGRYEFVEPGGQSHNQRHGDPHRVVVIQATIPGSDLPGDAHHDGPLPTDAHFHGIRHNPDELAGRVTGHTDVYTGEGA